jgi:hypothetical protein
MSGRSGRSGIVLDTLLNYRRLSLDGGLDREYICEHPVSVVVGGDAPSKSFLGEFQTMTSFVQTRVSRRDEGGCTDGSGDAD